MPKIWLKSGSSTWSEIKSVFLKTSSAWSDMSSVWVKTGSAVWSKVFTKTAVPEIATKVEITISNTATETKRLTGKLYRWTDSTSVTYRFRSSTNNVSYSNIAGASGTSTNPGLGLNNTLDQYVLTQADLVGNTTNYFQYVSRAVNSTYSTEAESVSFEVSFEMPRNLSLSSSKTSKSITISWTNDIYSARYEYQVKLSSNPTWGSSVFISPGSGTTSFTVSSLTDSTAYDFRVRGRTSTTNANGYFGNWTEIPVTTNAPAAPNPPTSLAGSSVTKDNFFLTWVSPTTDATHDAATGFDFGASTSNTVAPATQVTTGTATTSGEWRTITIADRPNNQELISSLSPGTTYYGWVRSRNSGGVSTWAVSSAITTTALKPPNNITGLAKDTSIDSETSLKFTWTAPTITATNNAATTFVYDYKTTDAAPTGAAPYETGDSTTNLTLTGLTANTNYYIFIKAKNTDGLSSTWVRGTGKTKATSNPPGIPSNVSAANPSQSGFRFTWGAPTSGGTVTKYLVAYSTGSTEPTTESASTALDNYFDVGLSTSQTFVGLNASTLYYCWVKARNADGTSAGVRRSATTAAAPSVGAPTWTAATNFQRTTGASARISWGWGNTGTLSPTTGTFLAMARSGMFWQFSTSAAPTTVVSSGFKDYTTTNDTRATVNGANFPYLLTSSGSSPDITYNASGRLVRVQAEARDYDFKTWVSAYTARI